MKDNLGLHFEPSAGLVVNHDLVVQYRNGVCAASNVFTFVPFQLDDFKRGTTP